MTAITRGITHSIKRADNEAIDEAGRVGNKKEAVDKGDEAQVM